MDLDQFSDSLPPSALQLLKLQQQQEQEQRAEALKRADDLDYLSRKPLVDPLQAWMAGISEGDPNTLGSSGMRAMQAMEGNAKNRQALQLEASKIRNTTPQSDLLEKMAGPLLRSTSLRATNVMKLPNGNDSLKIGDRLYEIIPDKSLPEGYRVKEIVSSGKLALGADTRFQIVARRVENTRKMLEAGGAFQGWSDDMINAWEDSTLQEAMQRLAQMEAGEKGVLKPPEPVVGGQPGPALPAAPKAAMVPGMGQRPISGFPGSPLNAPPTSAVSPGSLQGQPPLQPQPQALGTSPGFPKQMPPIAVPGAKDPTQIQQEELDNLVKQRDSMAADDPRRSTVNRNIALLRRENPKLVIKTGRMLKQDEGYGAQEGKDLATERKGYADLYQNAGKLEVQLNTLRNLYTSNPKGIVSGQLAPQFKAVKSGLESLGFKGVKDSARLEDVINSMSTNLSLHARTAEGQNLLPGAMSNYEDQLLQKMGPALSLTTQGRLQLIDFMAEIARANKRMAGYATEYEKKNGRLDAGWNAYRERKAREEMARLTLLNNKIMAQYQKGAR